MLIFAQTLVNQCVINLIKKKSIMAKTKAPSKATTVVEQPASAKIPETKTTVKSSLKNTEILAKKIKASREASEKKAEARGKIVMFERTAAQSFNYIKKSEETIYIPEAWVEIPEAKEYLSEVFAYEFKEFGLGYIGKDSEGQKVSLPTGDVEIRFARGERYIFKELQSKTADKKKLPPIVFESISEGTPSTKVINDKREGNQVKFLRLSSRNTSNLLRSNNALGMFKEVSPKKEAKNNLELKRQKNVAMRWAMESPEADIMAVASVLGLNLSDVDLMRDEVVEYALNNPQGFLKVTNDQLLGIKSTYILAKSLGILKFENSMIRWSDGGVITHVPRGKNELEIASGFLNSDDGVAAYEAILNLLR